MTTKMASYGGKLTMALEPGTRFGPYEIVEAIGAGGMVQSKRSVWVRAAWLAGALILGVPALKAQPAPGTPEALIAAAKQAAGLDHAGTFRRICVAPANRYGTPRPSPQGRVPDRDT